jgi:F0F1-type ATP synthase delta subunit
MKTSRAAIRYAKALLLESVEKNSIEETFNDMVLVEKTFANNIELNPSPAPSMPRLASCWTPPS